MKQVPEEPLGQLLSGNEKPEDLLGSEGLLANLLKTVMEPGLEAGLTQPEVATNREDSLGCGSCGGSRAGGIMLVEEVREARAVGALQGVEGDAELRHGLLGRWLRGTHGGLQAVVIAQGSLSARQPLAGLAPLHSCAKYPSAASGGPGIFRRPNEPST